MTRNIGCITNAGLCRYLQIRNRISTKNPKAQKKIPQGFEHVLKISDSSNNPGNT